MPYRMQPYEVIAVKGTMITASHGQHVITRNSSHFKLYHGETVSADDSSDAESVQDADDPVNTAVQPANQPVLVAQPVRRNPQRFRRMPPRLNDYIVNKSSLSD